MLTIIKKKIYSINVLVRKNAKSECERNEKLYR